MHAADRGRVRRYAEWLRIWSRDGIRRSAVLAALEFGTGRRWYALGLSFDQPEVKGFQRRASVGQPSR